MKYWTSCQNLSDSFQLVENKLGARYIKTKDGDLAMVIKNAGYIPRSGLFIAETIDKCCIVNGKSVLDIGTGEIGFLAHFALFKGANRVVGSDLDMGAIQHACQAETSSKKIELAVNDVYDNISP